MSDRASVLLLSEQDQVRQVVARVLRWNRYRVVEAETSRDAILSGKCDIALIDAAGRSEDLDAVTRDVLGADLARGILFFDGSSIDVAVRSLRTLLGDVDQAVARFRAE
jgi:hypothetical protein